MTVDYNLPFNEIYKYAKVFEDIEQGTEEWYDIRRGVLTASAVKALKASKLGDGAVTLAKKMAMEIVTNYETDIVHTYYMDRGNELEPEARKLYEEKTGNKVKEVGFVLIKELGIGVSPDGLVGSDGMVEFKAPKYTTHMDTLKSGKYDPQYYPQMQMQLLVTGRGWVDFVSYCPDMPDKHQMFIDRVKRDEKFQSFLYDRMKEFRGIIDEWVKVLS